MRTKFLYIFIFSLILCSCDKGRVMTESRQEPSEWITAKVAVVLPLSGENNDKVRYERICKMFEDNVIKAQFDLPEGVRLELEWYDENTLNVRKFANDLYYRKDVAALIGPLKDDNIDVVASVIYNKGIPMFVMTSSEEIVRRYSSGTAGVSVKEPFMWSLAETDVTQARIILAKAGTMGKKKISLISAGNAYGATFNKWVPHYAGEMGLTMLDNVQYSSAQELGNEFKRICESDTDVLICALDNSKDAEIVLEAAQNHPDSPKIYFTGSVLNSSLLKFGDIAEGAEGFSMFPSPYTGFHIAYQTRFGESPMPIEAQLYDSLLLTLISFAYNHYSGGAVTMNETLAALSDLPLAETDDYQEDFYWETTSPVWDYANLRNLVLDPIRDRKLPKSNPVGTLGNLKFAPESYTSIVKSTYINWMLYKGRYVALDYIHENGRKYSSYTIAWDWIKMLEEIENGSNSEYTPSLAEGNKAVLICGSEGWYNYRHQADLLYVYNTLKENMFSDNEIILIMRDDIAYHPKNPHPGVIKVDPNGENLYHDVVIDYRADTLSTKDIEDILVGNKSERLSTVLESTETDNVLLYWTGHGQEKSFTWLETGDKFTDEQMGSTVRKMYEDKKYQSMLILTEPCYSGSVVKAIEGTPLVLGISAASENESSYAENYSSELGVWMCDRFTLNLIRIYNEHNYINLLETYKKLNSSTLGSHVRVFNSENYYSLGDTMLWLYFYYFNY